MPQLLSKSSPTVTIVSVESSAIVRVAYDRHRQSLAVEFRDGSAYQYSAVPPCIYADLLRASSKGTFFNRYIRTRFCPQIIHPPD